MCRSCQSRPLEERFNRHTVRSGACLLWTAGRFNNGYGRMSVDRKSVKAHRVMWFLRTGGWPEDLLRHSCDVRNCVEMEHLLPGSNKENAQDMVSRGRQAHGERNGSAKLNAEDVHRIRSTPHEDRGVLARRFGVSRGTIDHVLQGRNWRNV